MDQTSIVGISHVALTVRDLDRSLAWYGEVLGFRTLMPFDTADFRRVILVHPSGAAVALTQHEGAADEDFDPRRTGLDHLSFGVAATGDLDAWADRLDAAGVGHSGVQARPETGSALLAFRDPDGIQLELYVQVGRPPASAV
jgi:glyoxylase I family protein